MISLYNLLFKAWSVVQQILSKVVAIQTALVDLPSKVASVVVAQQSVALGPIMKEQAEKRALLLRILAAVEPLPAVKILFDVVLEGQPYSGVNKMKITDSQKFTATIAPVDAKGNPAQVDGVPVWAAPDATTVTVTPAADGMSAEIAAVGPVGSVQVSVTADADLGTGVSSLVGTLQVDVVGGAAVSLQISTSAPVEQ